MAEPTESHAEEPRGFGEHTRGLAGEYAHEQGSQLSEDERRKLPGDAEATKGGTEYEYGARDFGDEPVKTTGATDEAVQAARQSLTEGK